MYVLRPITLDDLQPLLDLTRLTGFGLTTLPDDEKLMRRRIKESLRGFEQLADDQFRAQVRNTRQLQQAAQIVKLQNGSMRSTINGHDVTPTLVTGTFRLS